MCTSNWFLTHALVYSILMMNACGIIRVSGAEVTVKPFSRRPVTRLDVSSGMQSVASLFLNIFFCCHCLRHTNIFRLYENKKVIMATIRLEHMRNCTNFVIFYQFSKNLN